ncbi:MAG: elongation factor Ts [Bacteroidetes bacterium]|nr:MAG: elongation factor Ts [Bacteroidota bacterium]
MATITASDVNKLRKQTGAGMMDCKKALQEAEGDFEKAIEILRKKGQKVAAKRGDREASEGLIIAKTTPDNKAGVIVSVNCETDFVAKNQEFQEFANKIADIALENLPSSIEDLKALPYEGGISIGEKIVELIGKIGEKIDLADYKTISAEAVVAYNHPGNQIASLVGLSKAVEGIEEIGKDVAMQVAAMNPVAVDKGDVSEEMIQKEIEIGKEQAINEGKPAELAEKIAMGKLNKFFKENTLLNQEFIKDNKITIAQYLKDKDKDLTVTEFVRLALK